TVEEYAHLCVQFARARIEIIGADETNPAVEGERLRVQAPNARSGRFAKAPLELGAGRRLDLIEFDAGQELNALFSRYEVRRDEEQLALRFICDRAQLRGKMRLRLAGRCGHLVR